MKSDRLYGITLYLLNHKRASATKLASHFEVSKRSIQRDIDTLCMAGVPIIAYTGIHGGYEIQESFKMQAQLVSEQEYALIIASLQGYASATDDSIQQILQKIKTFTKDEYPIQLDLSIANEKKDVKDKRTIIESALQERTQIQMKYTTAMNVAKTITCEPIVLLYQWYAWYLIAYDIKQEGYRTYKLQRMENVNLLAHIKHEHSSIQSILQVLHAEDKQKYLDIELYCRKECRIKVLEYFNGRILKTYDHGDFIYLMHMPEHEHFWYANLLGMGTDVEVLKPISLRERIQRDCRNLLALYDNSRT